MQKIHCVVERITYQNPENGYSVLKCRVKDYSDLIPVIGNLIDANVGSVLIIEGNWKVDAKYGRQFVAENWEETLPATVYGMVKCPVGHTTKNRCIFGCLILRARFDAPSAAVPR